MHIDLDAFYSSCEEMRRPELKGKPVVVGDLSRKRSVVTTANYEARKFGIHSGMPTINASELCPDAIFLPPDFRFYTEVSGKIMQILRKHGKKFEQVSIDEAFLDVSHLNNFEKAKEKAIKIKNEIFQRFGITCSIGIAPNKLVAKIASAHKKPKGLTIVKPQEVAKFLEEKDVCEMPGIGPKTKRILEKCKVKTFKNLQEMNPYLLRQIFGKNAQKIKKMAFGIEESEVEEILERKSLSEEYTFEDDVFSIEEASKVISYILESLKNRLHHEKMLYKTLTLKIRYRDFTTTSKSISTAPNNKIEIIRELTNKLLQEVDFSRGIRLIGVKLSNLNKGQKRLFEYTN
jgi:DNA polymerase IV (DinB-like DNA polymerase)